MSSPTRFVLRLAGLWLLVAAGLLALQAWFAHDLLRAPWAERSRVALETFAAELSKLPAEGEARARAAQQRFGRGDLALLVLQGGPGVTLFEGRRTTPDTPSTAPANPAAPAAPAASAASVASASSATAAVPAAQRSVPPWFAEFVAAAPAPATAVVAAPAGAGTARTTGQTMSLLAQGHDLQQLAWQHFVRNTVLLLLLTLVATWWAGLRARRWRRALGATVAQAQALDRYQFTEANEPRWPELRDLTRAMNSVVRRLRDQVAAQAEQVVQLQRQAQTDAVTGLPLRAYFVARLADLLADARAPAASVLLVRVPDLATLNERHGREAADRLLVAVADVLMTYADRISGAITGRLAGQDFALGLPAAGAGRETAAAIQAAVAASPSSKLAGARIVVAGCDGLRGVSAGAALAAADAALARAEASGQMVVDDLPELGAHGYRAWRELIAAALAESRVRLGEFPVLDPQGRLIHIECPMRVQVEPGGDFLVARRWLAMAARSKLMPQVDLAAVSLALAAIAADGRPRCVHVAPRSLTSAGFARNLLARLKAAGDHAVLLSIEWTELPEASPAAQALREAVPAWRRLGVRVGVEHAGDSPRALPALKEIGIDYVKVDARHLLGVGEDAAARSYVESLVALIHSLGLQALAEGVAEASDLQRLWALGFDGATGPGVDWIDDDEAEAADEGALSTPAEER